MTEFKALELVDSLDEGYDYDKKCDGLYFRASRTCWFNREGLGDTVRLRLLKKRSCTGCGTCDWLSQDFEESKDYQDGNFPWIGINDIEHGKLYTVHVHSWQDYEGEYDYEISLVEVKDENTKQ